LLLRRRRNHDGFGLCGGLARLQALEAARGCQHWQHAAEDAHVLWLPPVDAHADVPAPVETDFIPAARQREHQLDQLGQDAGLGCARNHADVEEAV